jgi:hypothetical protein
MAVSSFDAMGQLAMACRKTYLSAVEENAKQSKRLSLIRKKVLTRQEFIGDVSMPRYTAAHINEICRQILSQSQ